MEHARWLKPNPWYLQFPWPNHSDVKWCSWWLRPHFIPRTSTQVSNSPQHFISWKLPPSKEEATSRAVGLTEVPQKCLKGINLKKESHSLSLWTVHKILIADSKVCWKLQRPLTVLVLSPLFPTHFRGNITESSYIFFISLQKHFSIVLPSKIQGSMYLICFCLILFKVVIIIILHKKKRPKHMQVFDLSFDKGETTRGNINQTILKATLGCLLKWNTVSHFYIGITSLLVLCRSDPKVFPQRTPT